MSQASESSQAPARQGPRTAAIVGIRRCQKRITPSKSRCRISRQVETPSGRVSICSFKSKPDEKAVPAPVTTSARSALSASTSSSARLSSRSIALLIALSRSGRFSVSTATASPSRSRRIVS
jgi:hypothetical protein